MKKVIKLFTSYLLLLFIVNNSNASPFKPLPVNIKIRKNCDHGLGFCIMARAVNGNDDGLRMVPATVEIVNDKLQLNFYRDNLVDEVENEFEDNSEFPVTEEYKLSDDLTEQLNLPPGASIAAGRYPIVRNSVGWQIILSILK